VTQALEELETETGKEKGLDKEELDSTELRKMAEEAPISKIVAVILRHAVEGTLPIFISNDSRQIKGKVPRFRRSLSFHSPAFELSAIDSSQNQDSFQFEN